MKLIARIAALAVMAMTLMAQSCASGGGSPDRYPSSSYGGQPRTVEVSWIQPNLYTPGARESGCRRGYSRTSHHGQAVCVECPRHTTIQIHQNLLACAACPSGYDYRLHEGRGYCRA